LSIFRCAAEMAAFIEWERPLLVRMASSCTVHLNPVGFAVWTTLNWMSLCCMRDNLTVNEWFRKGPILPMSTGTYGLIRKGRPR
jgi:hypothetical protein